jgi:hypothetical protein
MNTRTLNTGTLNTRTLNTGAQVSTIVMINALPHH